MSAFLSEESTDAAARFMYETSAHDADPFDLAPETVQERFRSRAFAIRMAAADASTTSDLLSEPAALLAAVRQFCEGFTMSSFRSYDQQPLELQEGFLRYTRQILAF